MPQSVSHATTVLLIWLMVNTYQRHPAGNVWPMLRWTLLGTWTMGMPVVWTFRRWLWSRETGTGKSPPSGPSPQLIELLALGFGSALAVIGVVREYL